VRADPFRDAVVLPRDGLTLGIDLTRDADEVGAAS
jgi:hypothetical protein